MRRRNVFSILAAGVGGIFLTLLVLWLAGWLGSPQSPAGTPSAAAAPSGFVTLDPKEVAASGILVTPLRSASARASAQAVATVVDLSSFSDLIGRASAADGQWRSTKARSAASSATYERDKALYADNQNVSKAELQSAEASATADRAAVRAARESLNSAIFAMTQQFGPVIGRWPLVSTAQALLSRRQVLVQVSMAGNTGKPPPGITLESGAGQTIGARYVSLAVRTDPRVQGASYFYIAPTNPELLAGSTRGVTVPQGPQMTGALVPADAVVVWQGESWTYRQTAPGHFQRIIVNTAIPLDGGYLDPSITPGSAIVIRGAQLLLSQEMQPPPGVAPVGGGDGDD